MNFEHVKLQVVLLEIVDVRLLQHGLHLHSAILARQNLCLRVKQVVTVQLPDVEITHALDLVTQLVQLLLRQVNRQRFIIICEEGHISRFAEARVVQKAGRLTHPQLVVDRLRHCLLQCLYLSQLSREQIIIREDLVVVEHEHVLLVDLALGRVEQLHLRAIQLRQKVPLALRDDQLEYVAVKFLDALLRPVFLRHRVLLPYNRDDDVLFGLFRHRLGCDAARML